MAPTLIRPSSGIGQFLAELDNDVLTVTLPVIYSFLPGDPAVIPGFPAREYRWTRRQERDFAEAFRDRVGDRWSSTGILQSTDGRHRIEVRVVVDEVRRQNALWRIRVRRYPDNATYTPASVCDPGSSHAQGGCFGNPTGQTWGTVIFSNTHTELDDVRSLEVEPIEIPFDWGTAQPQENLLDREVTRLLQEPVWRVHLRGFAGLDELNSTGTETRGELLELATDLAGKRAAAIENALTSATPPISADRIRVRNHGYDENEESHSKVRAEFFRTERIDTLAHEAGHMLGLGDEAVTDEASAGDPLPSPDYAAYLLRKTGKLVRRHDDKDIMSRGSTVQRWHYAPFLEALETLDPVSDWEIVDP